MKAVCSFIVILLFRQAISGIVRKPPAFLKPVYADSYLPAAMQVIFHAVEQLKHLQSEEATESSNGVTSTSVVPVAHASTSHQSIVQQASITTTSTTPYEETKCDEAGTKVDETSSGVESSTTSSVIGEESIEMGASGQSNENTNHQESPEVNEETPETNYATPETNYEAAEDSHGVEETNQEVPEVNHEWISSSDNADDSSMTETSMKETTEYVNPVASIEEDAIVVNSEDKKRPTIDSVVQDIYEILKPTTSKFVDEDVEASGESKSVVGMSVDRLEGIEDEEDETRFTRLGEKVTQVPRPSLSSYLRRSKVPPSPTLQQLANLYDSLSKDARKQGFGKYTGYSDEILNTLETSAEGGIGPQLRKILDKLLERNELTREDAKTRTFQAIRDLDNPSSALSKELRRLLPLRYSP